MSNTIRIDEHILTAHLGQWPAGLDGEALGGLKSLHATARKAAQEFRDSAATLAGSRRLTRLGLSERLSKDAATAIESLRSAEAAIERSTRRQRDALSARLLPSVPAGDHAAHAVRIGEIRRQLLHLPDVERWAALQTAVTDDETDVLEAVVSAPKFIRSRLLPADFMPQVSTAYRKSQDPVAARELDQIVQGTTAATAAVRGALRLIASTPGLSAKDRATLLAPQTVT